MDNSSGRRTVALTSLVVQPFEQRRKLVEILQTGDVPAGNVGLWCASQTSILPT
ncbi:MAG TPA: hypothetical protein VMM56_03620 [Planctomycetaceae bacterium]|nr:hypothetical protein [Planctomycetaceae bacterium]